MNVKAPLGVKICGLKDAAAVNATVAGGARYAGFNFYPPSPRAIAPEQAAGLLKILPSSLISVGLFVDPSDDDLRRILAIAPLSMIQLHGHETPARVAEIRNTTNLPIIKAVGIAGVADLATAKEFESLADLLLLDAKPPAQGLPGGNAVTFDWSLLASETFANPWLLAGGLNADNLRQAVATTKARLVDVSSGVETSPGHKSPEKIKAFLDQAQQIETCC